MLIDAHLVFIPLLLALAAIFAAAEASLFSLSRSQLETIRESRPLVYRRIRKLIYEPDALLSTLIIGNECLNILIGTFVVSLLEAYYGELDERLMAVVSTLLSVFLLLTFSEILPKILAFRMPVVISSILVFPTSWAHWAVTPLRKIFLVISREITRSVGLQSKPPSVVNEKDFLTLVEVGAESGTLDRDEKEMIFNVFSFSDIPVSAVMTQWSQAFHIKEGLEVADVLFEVRKKVYSRIPVVSPNNQVVGILYTKELLKLLLAPHRVQKDALKEAIFPPYIVSSHKKISKLFREFKLKKVHIALVVDEYGRHIGIITLEDILNALFRTQRRVEGKAP